MTQPAKTLSRRKFLMAAGAGTAATAAALAARTAGSDPTERNQGKASPRGYQVSEHINNYYRTTKV